MSENLEVLHQVPRFYLLENEVTLDNIVKLITVHKGKYYRRYQLLEDYFMGKHKIIERVVGDNKPNNKIITNYAEYITSIKTGYLLGKPVKYESKDNALMDELQITFDYNDEQDINSELGKLSSIHGHAFETYYIDRDGKLRIKYLSPKEMFVVYSTDIDEEIVASCRYYEYDSITSEGEETVKTFAEINTATETWKISIEDGEYETINEDKHVFGFVPVTEYINNDERLGDFENTISLMDSYEVIMSDSTNEVQYFSDAYLKVKGLTATEDSDLTDMKNNRVIVLDENGEADFLNKNINDAHIQNQLNRTKTDIHKFSKTPDLTDEAFASNLSGVAIRYKMWTLEQDTANKERKFKKGLQRRLKIITEYLNRVFKVSGEYLDVKIQFSRNIPQNELEVTQMVQLLQGLVDDDTRRKLLPYIESPKEVAEALKKQQEENKVNYSFDLNPEQKDNENTEEKEETEE